MTGRRKAARQRIVLAVTLSLAGHAGVIAIMALELDRNPETFSSPPAVEISFVPLDPPPRPPSPIEEEQADTSKPQAPTMSPPPAQRPAANPLPSAAPSPIAAAPGPAAIAGPTAPPSEFSAGCIGKRGSKEESVDCKLEVWSFFDGKPMRIIPGDDIPADKKAAYAKVAQRQATQRRPAAMLGNTSAKTCPQSNLGSGCLDDMLIPLWGSNARR